MSEKVYSEVIKETSEYVKEATICLKEIVENHEIIFKKGEQYECIRKGSVVYGVICFNYCDIINEIGKISRVTNSNGKLLKYFYFEKSNKLYSKKDMENIYKQIKSFNNKQSSLKTLQIDSLSKLDMFPNIFIIDKKYTTYDIYTLVDNKIFQSSFSCIYVPELDIIIPEKFMLDIKTQEDLDSFAFKPSKKLFYVLSTDFQEIKNKLNL